MHKREHTSVCLHWEILAKWFLILPSLSSIPPSLLRLFSISLPIAYIPKLLLMHYSFLSMFCFCCFLRGWRHLVLSPASFICLSALSFISNANTYTFMLSQQFTFATPFTCSFIRALVYRYACLLVYWSFCLVNVCLPIKHSASNGSRYEYQGNVPPLFSSILKKL